MFNFKERIKSYGFWISCVSIIAIAVQAILARAGHKIEEQIIADGLTTLFGLLAVAGFLVKPETESSEDDSQEKTPAKDENNSEEKDTDTK